MTKNVIWIDQNIENEDNSKTLEYFKDNLQDYNILLFKDIDEAYNEIRINEKFSFTLIYIIINGRLAEQFFNLYCLNIDKLTTVCATILYCVNENIDKTKPYYNDEFLNPGKIVKNREDVIKYIKLDECNWNNKNNALYNKENINNNSLCEFSSNYLNSLSDICYPTILGQLIDSSLLNKDDIQKFQVYMLNNYPSLADYFKPSKEKQIDISIDILANFLS